MKYERIKNLSQEEFRRLTGIKPETFQTVLSILNKAEKEKKIHGGKPNVLSIKEWLLMALKTHLIF